MAQRSSRAQQQASARTNEYFVPKDGIDREVITADICRYLGNDALVRPGNYENPQTRQIQQGYFITAYRNLTTAMIADLKADSERWDAERRQQQNASRGGPVNAEYRASTTHQSRQYYGPTEAAPGYTQPASNTPVYDNGSQYQSQGYGQPSASYATPTSGYSQAAGYTAPASYGTPATGYAPQVGQDTNYYVGASLEVDNGRRAPAPPPGGAQPRTVQYSSSTPSYQQDSRAAYYAQPGPPVSQAQYATQQPPDPFYGRAPNRSAAPVGHQYDNSPDVYDQGAYVQSTQAPLSSTSSTAATAGSSRRERESDRERDRHHRDRRR